MEAVYLKSQGLLHQDICRLSRISENTLRSYLRQFQEGGVERLKRTRLGRDRRANWPTIARRWRTTSARTRPVRPPRPPPTIERLTGIRRGPDPGPQVPQGDGPEVPQARHDPGQGRCRRAAEVPRRAALAPAAPGPAAAAGGLLRRCRPLRPRAVPGLPLVLRAAVDARPLGPQAVQRPGGDRRGHARVDDGRATTR